MTTSNPVGGRPVWVLPLHVGACGACAQSVMALQAPRYAARLREHGVNFARSPRHANVVVLTGTASVEGLEAVRTLLRGVPDPHALVAVGDCAIDGCVFRDSPHIVPSVAEALDVHVEIAGCPPAPDAILAAIVEAAQLLAGEEAPADQTDDTPDAADAEGSEDDSEEGRDA